LQGLFIVFSKSWHLAYQLWEEKRWRELDAHLAHLKTAEQLLRNRY